MAKPTLVECFQLVKGPEGDTVTQDQVFQILCCMGLLPTYSEVDRLLQKYKTASFTLEQVGEVMHDLVGFTQKVLVQELSQLGPDKREYLTISEMKELLASYGDCKFEEPEINSLVSVAVQGCDVVDGRIPNEQLVAVLSK